jgi:glutamate--cysteine ligase catalytic subunit
VGGGATRIPKSRYSSIDCYISEDPRLDDARHNDIPVVTDEGVVARLRGEGVDARLARHVAALFVRDPLVMFRGRITEVDDARSAAHFESIQSTNWRSMRWKPPPADAGDTIGWRVELRTMEVQLTDFENAAFTVFVVLLSRVVLFFDLNLYMPLSLVDQNFERANARGAATAQRFWFPPVICCAKGGAAVATAAAPVEMTLAQILLGDGGATFPGLIPLIGAYLDLNGCDAPSRAAISEYLSFVRNRATGAALTGAAWQRQFVEGHPAYARDSVVPLGVAGELVRAVAALPGEAKARGGGSGVFEKLVGPLQGGRGPGGASGGASGGADAAAAGGGGGAEAAPAPPSPVALGPGSVRLRGSSFFEEVANGPSSKCSALKELIDKHRAQLGVAPLTP